MIDINRIATRPRIESTEAILADATLSGRDAQDLSLAILNATIEFYKIQSLRSAVRTDVHDSHAEARIEQLKAERARIIQTLGGTKDAGERVRMSGNLSLSVEAR